MKCYTYYFSDGSVVFWYNKKMPKKELMKNEMMHGRCVRVEG